MLVEVAKINEVAPGGMKAVEANGKEIVLCNYDGKIYAVDKRCGHMNVPLEKGTLEGYILTCPMHYAQFDITTGEALSGPIPRAGGDKPLPEDTKTHDMKTYPVKIDGDSIKVEI